MEIVIGVIRHVKKPFKGIDGRRGRRLLACK